jgi:tetratricopeptide (TPR) repeat protein
LLHCDYAEAYQLRPKNAQYASEYALAAYSEGQYAEAERGWIAALQLSHDLAAHNPGAYRPYVAGTLNNLGNLYYVTGRLADADKAFSEALSIYRDLAAHNPALTGPMSPARSIISESSTATLAASPTPTRPLARP